MSTALMINSKQNSVNVEVSHNVQSLALKNISFFEEVKKYLETLFIELSVPLYNLKKLILKVSFIDIGHLDCLQNYTK